MGKAVTKVKAGNFYAMEYVSNNGVAKSMIRTYRFRLTGVPPNRATKLIDADNNCSVAEIKKNVQREYKLNPILSIKFIFKGKVLFDNLRLGKVGIHPKKDIITAMSTNGGGASESEDKLKKN